ncbi:MAG: glycosyltransferase family 9 protein [Nitrospirae bacterium]|nr:glycosyltransferase family 9 protein [Nitrospirota bacterium]
MSVDLEFFAKFPMLISAVSAAPIRIGLYHRRIRPEGILTHKVTFNFYRHISDIYLAYASGLNLTVMPEDYMSVLPSFREELEESLRSRLQLMKSERIILINVNSGDLFAFRKWPEQNFVSLLELLTDHHPEYTYLLIGSKSEHAYVEGISNKVAKRNARIINCAGNTTLKELFALIELAELVITNDSGPLHIASLYGKNLAAFFGPETPVLYGPVNKNSLSFYPDNLYCSPCMCVYDSKQSLYAETCEKNVCLSSITPEKVATELEKHFFYAPVNTP